MEDFDDQFDFRLTTVQKSPVKQLKDDYYATVEELEMYKKEYKDMKEEFDELVVVKETYDDYMRFCDNEQIGYNVDDIEGYVGVLKELKDTNEQKIDYLEEEVSQLEGELMTLRDDGLY